MKMAVSFQMTRTTATEASKRLATSADLMVTLQKTKAPPLSSSLQGEIALQPIHSRCSLHISSWLVISTWVMPRADELLTVLHHALSIDDTMVRTRIEEGPRTTVKLMLRGEGCRLEWRHRGQR